MVPRLLVVASVGLAGLALPSVAPQQVVFQRSGSPFELPSTHTPTHQVLRLLRSLDVAGSILREVDVITIKKVPSSSQAKWLLPIDNERFSQLSSMEVLLGEGKQTSATLRKALAVTPKGFDSKSATHYFEVSPLPDDDQVVITINSHFLSLTTPRPARLTQQNGPSQGMYWEGDLLAGFGSIPNALAPGAEVKVKIKSPTPRVFKKETLSDAFNVQQASGSNLVIFTNKLHGADMSARSHRGVVHFHQPYPVMVFANVTRLVEVSHWGSNVAIEDQLHLENRGPSLKGPFSRFVHSSAMYSGQPAATAHVLTSLTLELPQGASDPYYIDTIGNVSTSRFRPSFPPASANKLPSKHKARKESKFSLLELEPRYPIAGGWSYNFKIGFNLEAGRALKEQSESKYILKIPYFTNVMDVPTESATIRVRLPEGANDVKAYVPFPVSELKTDLVDVTYLDTTGRPTVLITKSRCTEKHSADVYITYTRSPLRNLQKPAAIAGWVMSLFLLASGLRRYEWKIGH